MEVDETCIGGKEQNKHAGKKLKAGRGPIGKQAALGCVRRADVRAATGLSGFDRVKQSQKPPAELDRMVDRVLAYRPASGRKSAKLKEGRSESRGKSQQGVKAGFRK